MAVAPFTLVYEITPKVLDLLLSTTRCPCTKINPPASTNPTISKSRPHPQPCNIAALCQTCSLANFHANNQPHSLTLYPVRFETSLILRFSDFQPRSATRSTCTHAAICTFVYTAGASTRTQDSRLSYQSLPSFAMKSVRYFSIM